MAERATRVGVSRDLLRNNQRATVAPAASIPRIQFPSGAARGLQQLSRTLFNASARVEDQLDQEAAAEAQTEGALAGLSGEIELRDYTTIRNREYNRSAISTFATTLETRSIADVALINRQFGDDPEVLATALNDYHSGVASELSKVDPAAGAAYMQRAVTRSQVAISRAEDTAFKLTRDQADAMLISSQAALDAELKTYATDLFSDNPQRSQAAASALGTVAQSMMSVYDAVDPVTGKPLYSASERAKAQAQVQSTVMRTATLGWFDQQENKTQAYLDFASGDFKIDLDFGRPNVQIDYQLEGKIRDQPLQQQVVDRMSAAAAATGPNIGITVISAGQDASGPRRTGSHRHDHGGAGDLILTVDGRAVTPTQRPDIYERFFENAAASGFTGLGHYDNFIHVGGGTQAFWGPDTRSASADPRFANAAARGYANPINVQFGNELISADSVLTPADLRAVDAEMRARINFTNSQADRATRQEAAALDDAQNRNSFDLSVRLYNGGREIDGQTVQPLDRQSIVDAVSSQRISPSTGEAFLKALSQEAPTQSNLTVYDEALRRLDDGEDITTFVLNNQGNLSRAHASKLIEQNRERIDDPEGQRLTEEQRGYLTSVKSTIAPEGLLPQLDAGASIRAFEAEDEYRKRVGEGEQASVVARDIIERSREANRASQNSKLQGLLRPRFSVSGEAPGTINVPASAQALQAALQGGNISEESYRRQRSLIIKWADIQKGLE